MMAPMGDFFAALSLLPALALTFFVPGLAVSLAIFPRSLPHSGGPIARAGLSALLSLLVNGALALTLAVLGWLYTPVLLAAQAAVVATALVFARRRSWRWRAIALPSVPPPSVSVLAGLLVLAVLGSVWAPELRIIQRDRMPTSGVTWYYWDLADQVARNHSLPEESLEWGRARPYPTTYLFFSVTTAAYEQLTNADVRAEMEAFRLALLAVALVLGWLTLRILLTRLPAAMVLLFLFGGLFFLNRFSAYRPESFGVALCLGGSWLLLARVLGAERPSTGGNDVGFGGLSQSCGGALSAVAALAFAAAYLSHAIPLTALALWLLLTVAATAALRRIGWHALLPIVPIALAALIVGVAVTFAIDQEFPLARAAAPGGEVAGRDLTWQIILATEGTDTYRAPPDFEAMLDKAAREPWANLDLVERPYLLVVFLLPFLAWRLWTPGERGVALGALAFGVALGVLAAAFYLVYDTYVPQRTGPDRLAPYGALALAPLSGLGVAGLARAVGRRRRAGVHVATGVVLLALGVVLFLPTARDFVRRLDRQAIRPDAYAELKALDASLPADAVLLTNAYTDGSVNGILHRLGLTNGRVPFQAVPEFRDETIELMERTRRFLVNPASEPNLLREYGVTHILLANRTWALGGSALWPADGAALTAVPGITFVSKTDNFVLYDVAGSARTSVVPDTDRRDAAPWLLVSWAVTAVVVWGVVAWGVAAPGLLPGRRNAGTARE